MLLAVRRPQNRGTKGNKYPTKRKYFDRSEYMRLKGAKRMAKTSGTCVATWLSGCGTTRGAGSTRSRRRLEVEDRGELVKPFRRVSCRRVSCGGEMLELEAAAARGSSAGSPSKKRVIAIWSSQLFNGQIGEI